MRHCELISVIMNDILKGLAGTILITGVALAVLLSFQNKDKKNIKKIK